MTLLASCASSLFNPNRLAMALGLIGEYLGRVAHNLDEFAETKRKLAAGEPFEIERSGEYAAVIAEASLSFLGLGQQPPAPSWGSMLNTAKNYVENAPWMAVWPGLSIFLLVLSFNLLGDGLRDALDPRHG